MDQQELDNGNNLQAIYYQRFMQGEKIHWRTLKDHVITFDPAHRRMSKKSWRRFYGHMVLLKRLTEEMLIQM